MTVGKKKKKKKRRKRSEQENVRIRSAYRWKMRCGRETKTHAEYWFVISA